MPVQPQVTAALWLVMADADSVALRAATEGLQPQGAVRAALEAAVAELEARPTPDLPPEATAAAARAKQRALRLALAPIAAGLNAELWAAQLRLIDALQPILDLVALLSPGSGAALHGELRAARAGVARRSAQPDGPDAQAEQAELLELLGLSALSEGIESGVAPEGGLRGALPSRARFAAQLQAARRRRLAEALRPLEDHLMNVSFDAPRDGAVGAP
jgi:hypothetical protein